MALNMGPQNIDIFWEVLTIFELANWGRHGFEPWSSVRNRHQAIIPAAFWCLDRLSWIFYWHAGDLLSDILSDSIAFIILVVFYPFHQGLITPPCASHFGLMGTKTCVDCVPQNYRLGWWHLMNDQRVVPKFTVQCSFSKLRRIGWVLGIWLRPQSDNMVCLKITNP